MKLLKAVNKDNIKYLFFDYFIIALGSLFYAVSVVIFTAPNNIAPGGLTGVATMLNYAFSLPIGTMIFVMNIPLFIWGTLENGTSFLAKSLTGTALVSIAIDVLTPFLPAYTGDVMLASIFGGILNGAGLGLIFYRGGSTGGTDIVALNLHKRFPYLSTGSLIMATDFAVLVAAYFVYDSIDSALYAAVAIFVSIKVIDSIAYGTSRSNGNLMFIITDNYEYVVTRLAFSHKRGVTLLQGQGAYSGNEKRVIMCAVRPHQVFKITNEVKACDENAFIIVTTAGTISGRGFAKEIKNG